MVMQRDGSLNQSLQKFLFRTFRLPPHVFPDFVSIIKVAVIEELDPAIVSFPVHAKNRT